VIVPEAPERFLVEFLPAFVANLDAPSDPGSARPSDADARRGRRVPSGAGVAVRVVDVGEWTLRLSERTLRVSPGVADDVAFQLSLRGADFTPLVIEPVRRALQAPGAADAGARQLWARGFWTRLGRFDEETADLLRRQEGRMLLRVDDAGTSRNVALTPGLQQYSLDGAECCIDCDLDALYSVQEKRKNPLDLFYQGGIRISGDAQIALAMAGLFL
jgi:SCP-2 sterol transfer family